MLLPQVREKAILIPGPPADREAVVPPSPALATGMEGTSSPYTCPDILGIAESQSRAESSRVGGEEKHTLLITFVKGWYKAACIICV